MARSTLVIAWQRRATRLRPTEALEAAADHFAVDLAHRAWAAPSSSRTIAPAPSPSTMPVRFWSNGRLARAGSPSAIGQLVLLDGVDDLHGLDPRAGRRRRPWPRHCRGGWSERPRPRPRWPRPRASSASCSARAGRCRSPSGWPACWADTSAATRGDILAMPSVGQREKSKRPSSLMHCRIPSVNSSGSESCSRCRRRSRCGANQRGRPGRHRRGPTAPQPRPSGTRGT